MDKLQKLYLERDDLNAKIVDKLDVLRSHLSAAHGVCMSLEAMFTASGDKQLADFFKQFGDNQTSEMKRLHNSIGPYFPSKVYR